MDLPDDEIFKKYAEQCLHCTRNTLLPYECELICIASGYNVLKQKKELTKKQRKEKLYF